MCVWFCFIDNNQHKLSSEKPVKSVTEKPSKPLEKSIKPALERPSKPSLSIKSSLEKQNKSQEKVVKLQSTEKANKSPPPPPPRRNYPTTTTTTGMTTTRSGEVIYTSRKESVTTQVCLLHRDMLTRFLGFTWDWMIMWKSL